MKKLVSYLVLAAALVFAWKANALRLDVYGYTSEDLSWGLASSLIWTALPAVIAAIAISNFYKRVSALPRLAFFLMLLVGAILISSYQFQLIGVVVFILTIKNRALFFNESIAEQKS